LLSNWALVFFGRTVYVGDSGQYHMPGTWKEFLGSLSVPFGEVHYVCLSERRPDAATAEDLVPVDESICLHPDDAWHGSVSWPTKAKTFRSNLQIDLDRTDVVTYSLLPGTYGFVLTPFALSLGDVNVLYFGKDARVSAHALQNGPLINSFQRVGYAAMQRFAVSRADIAFVRDPRMLQDGDTSVRLSKPITDLDLTADSPPRKAEKPEEEPFSLLFVGKFREAKGLEYLLGCLEILADRPNLDVRLRLVGDGPKRESIERLARDRGLRDRIDFTGYIEGPERLQAQFYESDVFVLSSIAEGFPRVLNEALAAGIPIVSTDVGGIPVVLEHGEHSLLVNPRSDRELAEAVERVLTDADLRERLVRRGQELSMKLNGDPVSQHLHAIRSAITGD